MNHILEADGIQLSFGMRKILSDVYLQCETRKITGLLGRNGAGKTCLLNIIYGTMNNEDKSVRIDHKQIQRAFLRPGLVAYLPQFHFIPPSLNLKRIFADFRISWSGFKHDFDDIHLNPAVRLSNLSGGLRRLIETYVIIRSPTQFMMLDEPFTHIMPLHVERIKAILMEEKQQKGILMTDHLYRHIVDIADRLYLLANGKTWLVNKDEDLERHGYLKGG
jgi:ABC-type lipopolysaccharide export system ATPase subunit